MKKQEDKNAGWIPIEKELPDVDEDGCSDLVLISFSNVPVPTIGRYIEDAEGGAFHDGDEERTLASCGLVVNAWMPLPENYKEDIG